MPVSVCLQTVLQCVGLPNSLVCAVVRRSSMNSHIQRIPVMCVFNMYPYLPHLPLFSPQTHTTMQDYEGLQSRNMDLQRLTEEQEKALGELGSHLSE